MITFTQTELNTACAATANTPDAPRSCGFIVKNRKRFLIFPHANGKLYAVRERTETEIYKYWEKNGYLKYGERDRFGFELVQNSQFISDCNGNIYAKFICLDGSTAILCIADYEDYIERLAPADNIKRR